VAERVLEAGQGGRLRTAEGGERRFDVVVGADGAGSVVRRCLLQPTPTDRLMMAAGWFAPGDAPMLVRFIPGLQGYWWLFPRAGHVGVGICAPLGAVPTAQLMERLEREVGAAFPSLARGETRRYAHTIPSPSAEPRSLREVAGEGWALVGDAAALADPITGEGIYFALRSAELLAQTLLRSGSAAAYPDALLADCGAELLRAAELHGRFYAPGFTSRMLRYAARSRGIRRVMGELVLGEQGYRGLKRRLLRALPGFLLDSARARLSGRLTSAC
jgi:flavin-dependent dehydrogenase